MCKNILDYLWKAKQQRQTNVGRKCQWNIVICMELQ